MVSDNARVEHIYQVPFHLAGAAGHRDSNKIRSFDEDPVGLARSGVCMVCMKSVDDSISQERK